jgi:ankyrin repeat protein
VYAGANVRAVTRLGGFTPLLMASERGYAGVIDVLLKAGADPKIATSSGTTPLMFAAASGQTEAVRLLLDKGVDVNAAESARGETALMFATAANRVDAMKMLIASGASVKAATKVVDLKAQTNPEEEAFLRAQQGGQRGAPAAAGRGAAAEAAPASAAQNAPQAEAGRERGGRSGAPAGGGGRNAETGGVAGLSRQFRFAELVNSQGGLTPLLFATRQGFSEAAQVLLDAGADVNQISGSDCTSPLLMSIVNGHFDLAKVLIDRGANPRRAADNGVTPLYAVLNVVWAPKALYPQPQAYLQQQTAYLDLMKMLLDKGVDVNARLTKKVWYSGYNFDLSGVDEIGATPFWRAAYASDVDAMRLLVSYGADPNIPTVKPAGRPRTGDGGRETVEDVSGVPPVPVGGPGVTPLQAASGVGYGEGFAANSHRNSPAGFLPAVKYLVEELGVDVNARDHEGNTALHHAAARGDNELILYLVSRGADVKAVNRAGETTVDMANGPVQRTQPFPETIALLEKLGAKNNHRCKSC